MLQINERMLFDDLYKMQSQENKYKSLKKQFSPSRIADLSTSSRYIEEYFLALLLNFPDLRSMAMTIPQDYFEHAENRDIFDKWLANPDLAAIKESLDPAILGYCDSLLLMEKKWPRSLQQNKKEREAAFADCINRLQEKYFKNVELKKKLILLEEASKGADGRQIETLKEQGINESEQLLKVFKKRRRFFSRTKGVP
jgi:hypothetical protein